MTDSMTAKKPKKQKTPDLIAVELIDQLLAQVENKDAESILGESGLAGQLKKMLADRILMAELSHHLDAEDKTGNHRNGSSAKTVLSPGGEMRLIIPRDRLGSVADVSRIMADIMMAGDEQSAGMGQINQAVIQMDASTQQNAALVEEAAAAASSLQEQAVALKAVVRIFQVDGAARGMTAASSTACCWPSEESRRRCGHDAGAHS